MTQNPFMERMERLTDDQLKDVIWIQYEEYTEEALEAAKAVAKARGLVSDEAKAGNIQSEGEDQQTLKFNVPQTFGECLKAVDFKKVEQKLTGTFKEPDKAVEALRKVYQTLMTMAPQTTEPQTYLFVAQLTNEYVGKYPFDVFGVEEGSDEPFGLEIMPWNEWLGLTVYEKTRGFVERLGLEEFVALCLRKMTVLGYTETEIEAKVADLMQYEFDVDDEEEEEA